MEALNTGMVTLNGVSVIDPSELSWSLQDISASDAGRNENMEMKKMRIGQIRTYQLTWNMIDPADAATILQAINSDEIFPCTLHDVMDNAMETRRFYVGDRTAPFKQWRDGVDGKLYSKLSFTLIEEKPNSNTNSSSGSGTSTI